MRRIHICLAVVGLFNVVAGALTVFTWQRYQRVTDYVASTAVDPEEQRFRQARARGGPIVALEKWKAEYFFQSPRALQICDAISSFNQDRLQQLIEAEGADLEVKGQAGFTLLRWAYSEDNLKAFEMLLEVGASPDVPLDNFVWILHVQAYINEDSILFTSLRHHRYDYFVTALKHSDNPNQLDSSGESLIHVFLGPFEPSGYTKYGYTREFLMKAIIDSGMKLDSKNRFGSVATHLAIQNERPRLCLQLLKSGVDPSLQDESGRTVSDLIEKGRTRLEKRFPEGGRNSDLRELEVWLDANAAADAVAATKVAKE